MNERSHSSRVGDVLDQLTNIRHLNEAVFMASADSSVTTDATNALQSICNIINDRLVVVEEQLEKIMEELR